MLSFFHPEHPQGWNGGDSTTAFYSNSPTPSSPVSNRTGSGLLSPQRQYSPISGPGLCTLSMEAPPGKVLSVVFLNQTCSRKNRVRVDDASNDVSTVWDGCSQWISPGYDVTTSTGSGRVVIDLRDIAKSYALKVHVAAVGRPAKDGLFIRYISPVVGYIQTPGWHPYAKRTFSGLIHDRAAILVPSNHGAVVSVAYKNIFQYPRKRDACSAYLYQRLRRPISSSQRWQRIWCVSYRPQQPIDPEVMNDASEVSVEFWASVGRFFTGLRVMFPFHQPSTLAELQPLAAGMWNCTVPSWPEFYLHLACNHRTECAGREDETGCPDNTCQQEGLRLDDTCYVIHTTVSAVSWSEARTFCKERGASLVSFPTVNAWYHLFLLARTQRVRRHHVGLRSADEKFPHMYRSIAQWSDGTISHYARRSLQKLPPTCGDVHRTKPMTIFMTSCSRQHSDVICRLPLSSNTEDAETETRSAQTSPGTRPQRDPGPAQPQSHWTSRSVRGRPVPLPAVSCPRRHWTHEIFACDAQSACWLGGDVAPGDNVAAVTSPCGGTTTPIFQTLFTCANGGRANRVPYSVVCDHLQDCADNSDEGFCVFPPCTRHAQHRCANGQCLPLRQFCDEIVQCVDGSDEDTCPPHSFQLFHSVMQPRPPLLGDFDGRGNLVYTPLVTGWETGGSVCPETHLFCPGDGYCLPVYARCNGIYDCPGHEDELSCDSYTCPGLYRCRGYLTVCLHSDHVCDGWPQCQQHDDERFCNLICPEVCTCLGHAFTCTRSFPVELFPSLRYLGAGGTGLEPRHLGDNLMLVHLNLSDCHLARLGILSLLSLDLSDNLITAVSITELIPLPNLQNISLARNPLSELFLWNSSVNPVNDNLLHLDLTHVQVDELDVRSSLPFPRLLSLNLSGSSVKRFLGDGFRSMTSLATLDLRGCPTTTFPRDVFSGLEGLRRVFASNYKLCCPAALPEGFNTENCEAPFNEVSSCSALLRTDVYRACLSVLASLAVTGNVGCFCLRVFGLDSNTGFSVFVAYLCVSDFVMGVYLVMIGVADHLYLGRYLWEDDRWRHSAACQVAGVLALLSSEVSALIICLITLDRFLVIQFPLSGLRFSPFTAHVASLVTWAGGAVLVTIPLLPVTSYVQFYGQTGICIPLPIIKNDSDGHHYAFGVMVLLNLVLFIMIAVGQISVYLSMTNNAMTSIDATRKSRDFVVARRLVTVVVSDFLCWFPLGLLGVLAAQGVPVPGEVNVAMAIFVLPLNSALNPFLYTLNMIQEKRRKANELKLLKVIMDSMDNRTRDISKE